MRITSGNLKNRLILSREGRDTRPTLERLKEAIYSIIYDKIKEAKFLDLYAGTGNMSFEALSRGAKKAILIEQDVKALKVIIDNVERFNLSSKCRAYKNNVLRAIEILENKNEKFDIIFMDPPYAKNLTTETIEKISDCNLLEKDGVIICEHGKYEKLADEIGQFIKYDERDYNRKIVTFFKYKLGE